MPLIRYRIGDMGVWSEEACSCGRNWPLLKEIKGRVTDIFLTTNGDLIDGEFFTHLLYFQDWVQKFQVIQENYNYIKFIIVPQKKDSNSYLKQSNDLAEIKNKVKQVMGEDCKIEFEFVNDIEKSTSGKYRYTISKVPLP
jgi:phenylacetate-CoA ligase